MKCPLGPHGLRNSNVRVIEILDCKRSTQEHAWAGPKDLAREGFALRNNPRAMTEAKPDESAIRLQHHVRHWDAVAPALSVFLLVFAAQIWFVGRVASEVPWGDSWGPEGGGLFPAWINGTFEWSDLFHAHNEHRIVWTRLLNLGLFVAGGQWDPSAQQTAGAFLRALAAAVIAYRFCGSIAGFAVAVSLAYLPVLAWHNVIWGFQSQVFFSLGFGSVALYLWSSANRGSVRRLLGFGAAFASMLAMGAGYLVPAAWIAVLTLRLWRQRAWRTDALEVVGHSVLIGVAAMLSVRVPEHELLRADSLATWAAALMTGLAWPHVSNPLAALILNAPLAAGIVLACKRHPLAATPQAEGALALGFWGALIVAAAAYSRGGSPEFVGSIPSRYVDFVVLLPLANVWWLVYLVRSVSSERRLLKVCLSIAWAGFLLAGAVALAVPVWRGLVLPRLQDRDVAVRLLQVYQQTGDASVFTGRSKLQTPGVGLELVDRVLRDPALAGRLPPALQPEIPMGFMAALLRWLREWVDPIAACLGAASVAAGVWHWRYLRRDQKEVSIQNASEM